MQSQASSSYNVLPFDDIRDLIEKMPTPEFHRIDTLFSSKRPIAFHDNLDVFLSILHHLSYYQEQYPPSLNNILCAVFVGAHGITQHDVLSNELSNINNLMSAFQNGETPVNRLCAQHDSELKIFEVGLEIPTEDASEDDAMSEKETVSTIAYGMEALAGQTDILILSSLGAGSNFIALLLASELIGGDFEEWVDPSDFPELNMDALKELFLKTKKRISGDSDSPLDLLRRIGGREIAACIGAIIAARYQKTPIILDSLSSLVAALLIKTMNMGTIEHCLLGHLSSRLSFVKIVNYLELAPLINMDFPIDGGIGGLSSIGLLKSALIAHIT